MRKRILLISLLILSILGIVSFWYREGGQLEVKPLTTDEKKADLQYLFGLVQQVYPFYGLLEQTKGLEHFEAIHASFLERAERSTDNPSFLKLVYDYMTFLGQAGHAQIVYDEPYNPALATFYQIEKRAYRYRDYWREQAAGLSLYVHSSSEVQYESGYYVLKREYSPVSGTVFPAGSVITAVNSQPVDEYVKSLQARFHLQMDAKLNKPFLQQLFCIAPENDYWDVELLLPEGTKTLGQFPVLNGYKDPYTWSRGTENVEVRELAGQTGYIRLHSFGKEKMDADRRIIDEFMNQANGRFNKLIIDVRNNSGGEDDYWTNLLIKPLLKAPVKLVETGNVREGFLERYGWRFALYRRLVNSTITNRDRYDVTDVRKSPEPTGLPADWGAFQVTRTLQPERTWDFQGKLYVLADARTYSAADHYTAAIRQLKLGTVVGTNTAGGSSVFMESYRYALPNSGILFKLETDLNWNAEGQINEIYGTMPDIWLDSTNDGLSVPLGEDPWVEWVRKQP